ncbi:hypothetical protein HID58_021125 [Brassica napus]|uniref:X8 domain-containing protein n=2 Tax=Brassica TaxID=3705 RepID=A0ABQ8CVH8_BRANA|nr:PLASMODESMATA CALLOSE-BINDING PROTEIN 4-like [Brassica napus]KAH0921107.1 hypothetical protein HID58_021125 [Brassica napus]CAG7868405.1 unnamed protein product [Brassica rapa]VDC65289.1 unnamed protein product [Brassica rapa]
MAKQSYFFLFLSLVSLSSSTTTTHDVLNPPTVFPTNPTTTPPVTTFPPVTITPTNPTTTVPLTPPVTTVPATLTPPVTNPVTQYPPTQPSGMVPVPVIPPPVTSNSPSVSGQSWCVAKPGASQTSLQLALDYACGLGGADCSQIQQGGNCYSPISLQNHASFAFNSYYQKNPSPQSCDFGGAASLVSTNPSTGSCIYQTDSSTSTTPTPSTQTVNQPPVTSTPIIPTGGGIMGVGTPPAVFNPANPSSNTLNNPLSGGPAVYGFDGSPNGNNPTLSDSTNLQLHFDHTMVVTLFLHAVLFH